ncbi:ABC transporter ATP-binding protein [Halococcus agarilyticus]|uniref:ABC transporter ATP-binding protein n=1 Tax=Halococcus agarilyticus TaxID=1232219 RepID=UPI0006778EC5
MSNDTDETASDEPRTEETAADETATDETTADASDGATANGTETDGNATGTAATGGTDEATDATTAGASTSTDHPDGLLAVSNLDAGYGELQILDDVDLDVGDGEYVTIVGPNGAGKSTVMKAVFGLATYMDGQIAFDGEDISGNAPETVIRRGLSYVPQNDNVFAGLSVRENLEMGAYILDSVPDEALEDVFERFPILEERQSQRAGTLSGGQQQMLAMGRALMLDPDLLLLDEPSAGLAPDLVDEMFDRVDAINDAGTAVLVVEQNAKEALRRCDRGYVLVQGANRYTDTGDALLGDEQVRREFLGG